jgi:hypothetical protein
MSQQSGEGAIHGEGGVRVKEIVLRDFKQDGFAFGILLFLVGGIISIVPCAYIRGVGGNIVAGGIAVLLYVGMSRLIPKIRKSNSPALHAALRLLWLEER